MIRWTHLALDCFLRPNHLLCLGLSATVIIFEPSMVYDSSGGGSCKRMNVVLEDESMRVQLLLMEDKQIFSAYSPATRRVE